MKKILACVVFLISAQVFCFAEEKSSPEIYKILPEDTLWDLSEEFYGDPWKWKIIWSSNSYIQNPDLIYPGNKLFIPALEALKEAQIKPKLLKSETISYVTKAAKATDISKTKKEITVKPELSEKKTDTYAVKAETETVNAEITEGTTEEMEPEIETTIFEDTTEIKQPTTPEIEIEIEEESPVIEEKTVELIEEEIALPEKPEIEEILTEKKFKTFAGDSFVVPKDWKYDGVIAGDRDKKILIAEGDTVYLNIGSAQGLTAKMRCLVYRMTQTVKDPKNGRDLGYIAQKIAILEVLEADENASSANVITSYDPLKIGDWVSIIRE